MNYLLYIGLALLAYTTVSRAQIVTPERAFAVNNGSVTLSCPADSTSWLRYNGNDLVPVTEGNGVVVRGAELIIEGFHSLTHAGSYYCIATNNNMTTVSCPAEIIHARIQASLFLINPVNTVVNVNGTTVMTCQPPFSEPTPLIHWRRNGTDLNLQSDARLTVLATGNLYITNTQLSDEGEYQCIAHNEVTGATRRSTIGVLTVSHDLLTPAGPNITITPVNTLIKSPGEFGIFECIASGHPPPEIRWEKLHSQIFPLTASVLQSGSLVIDPVTSDEGGVYRCLARNSEGEVYRDVRLEVKGPPDFTEEPSAMVTIGDVSALSWTVQAKYPVKALLFHNGRLLESLSSDSGLSLTHALGGLSSDGGIYQCIAQGLYGCSQSVVFVISTPPGTTQSPPTMITSSATETTSTITETTTTPTTTPTATDASTTENIVPTANATSPSSEPTQSTTDGFTATDSPRQMITAYPDSVELSGPVEIVCVATIGAGVVWYGPSGSVLPSHDVVADLNVMNATLIVDSPGTYTCRAVWGMLMLNTSVTVTAAPLGVLVSDSVTARIGEPVELLCEGEGSGVGVEWTRASGESLREGGVVSSSVGQVTSKYQIMAVTFADDGDYVCTARSPYFEQPLYAIITLTVLGLPIGPPLNVIVVVSPNGGVVLAWEPPQTDSKLLGYKINYGNTQDPPTMAARESTNIKTEYFWVRPDIFLEYGEEVMVVVWAYSLHDEGAGLSVVVSPAGLLVPTESPTGPPLTGPPITGPPLTGPPLTGPPLIGPPQILVNQPVPDGGVWLVWKPPQTDSKLLGYKINYGNTQDPPTMAARESTDIKTAYFWVRPDIFLEYGEEVMVVVWAYSLHDEGAGVSVVVYAVKQIVRSCSVSSAHTLSYTPDPHALTSLTHVCTEARITQDLNHSTAYGTIVLDDLLPSCSYSFHVTYEDGETVSCDYTTPFDKVDVSAVVYRHENGSVLLRWILPVALRNQLQLVIDVDWGNGWVGVVSGDHLPVVIENHKQEFIKLRFTLNDWTGVAVITVPVVPTEITTTFEPAMTSDLKSTDLALLYGVIFGALLVLCVLVLVVILSLKYVQFTRRESDKVSDDKEKEREYFRRMSLERVSINTVKRSAQSLDSRASSTTYTTETDI